MKRTKRYGGFRIGDKVQRKDGKFIKFQPALVIGFSNGYIRTHWTMNDGTYFESVFAPNQLINLTRIEECERNKEQLDKFTRKHFNQSADEYLKEDMEMTKKIIEDFGKPFELPVFDWRATDYSKDLLKEEHTNGAIETTPPKFKLNVKPNLPSPYTRDVYTTTKDF